MTRAGWGAAALLVAWLAVVVAVLPESIRERWPLVAGGLALAFVAGWWLAGRFLGRERWLLAAGAAVLTLRVPVPTGEETAMLLAPLYAVLGLAALVLVRADRGAAVAAAPDRSVAGRLLDMTVPLVPGLSALSLLWTVDRQGALTALAFFLVPFLLAYLLVRTWVARGVALLPAAWGVVVSVLVAAAVGLYQAAASVVWWNPKVIDANRFRPDFRTNSLFWDPNIYGRALVVGLLVVVAWLLVGRLTRWRSGGALAAAATLVAALWHTFSQSSWVALSAALVIVAVLTIPPRPRRWTAALLAVVVLVGTPIAAERLAGDDATGRAEVVRAGIDLALERPIAGWGAGTFEGAARERALAQGDYDPRLTASHTTPVTVFAELGALGAAAYVALLAAAAMAVLARWRRSSTPAAAARARGDAGAGTGWPRGAVIWATGSVVAITAHSLLYAGYFEDATLWVALAVLAGSRASRHASPGAPRA